MELSSTHPPRRNFQRVISPLWKWPDSRNPEQIRQLLVAELHFLFLRLREYPKCYWIWLYRKWCLEVCPDADWDTELKLVTKMLEVDSRNCTISSSDERVDL